MKAALALGILLCGVSPGCRRSKPEVGKTPVPVRAPSVPPALPAEAVGCVEADVAAGFVAGDDIVERCMDAAEVEGDRYRQPIARLVAEAMAKHKIRELTWRTATDCDRLDAAFAAMERDGIVARQNFADCQTCGVAEIQEEVDKAAKAGKRIKGYAFYHEQDTESAVAGDGIYLSYGAIGDDNQTADVAIGRRAVKILGDFGLHTSWNGKVAERIAIKPLRWERRRFTPAPEVRAPFPRSAGAR